MVEPEPFAWVFAILGGGILVWVGFMVLCVWAGYWFFRLAFRHAGMDVERWKRAGMPDRMPKRRPAPTPPRPWFQ